MSTLRGEIWEIRHKDPRVFRLLIKEGSRSGDLKKIGHLSGG